MIRGTTIKIKFNVPIDVNDITLAYVTFVSDSVSFEKSLSDLELEEGQVIANLTQADTLRFEADEVVKVQLRFKLSDGQVSASKIKTLKVSDILKEGEI